MSTSSVHAIRVRYCSRGRGGGGGRENDGEDFPFPIGKHVRIVVIHEPARSFSKAKILHVNDTRVMVWRFTDTWRIRSSGPRAAPETRIFFLRGGNAHSRSFQKTGLNRDSNFELRIMGRCTRNTFRVKRFKSLSIECGSSLQVRRRAAVPPPGAATGFEKRANCFCSTLQIFALVPF